MATKNEIGRNIIKYLYNLCVKDYKTLKKEIRKE